MLINSTMTLAAVCIFLAPCFHFLKSIFTFIRNYFIIVITLVQKCGLANCELQKVKYASGISSWEKYMRIHPFWIPLLLLFFGLLELLAVPWNFYTLRCFLQICNWNSLVSYSCLSNLYEPVYVFVTDIITCFIFSIRKLEQSCLYISNWSFIYKCDCLL